MGIEQIERGLLESLPDRVYSQKVGNTDSELAFMLFLEELGDIRDDEIEPWRLHLGLRNMIVRIMKAQQDAGLTLREAASSLNFAVTDGTTVVATRCRTDPNQDPPTLYYHAARDGRRLQKKASADTVCQSPHQHWKCTVASNTRRMCNQEPLGHHSACYIASEPLDFAPGKWTLVEPNSAVIATRKTVQIVPLDLPRWQSLQSHKLTPTWGGAFEASRLSLSSSSEFELLPKSDDSNTVLGSLMSGKCESQAHRRGARAAPECVVGVTEQLNARGAEMSAKGSNPEVDGKMINIAVVVGMGMVLGGMLVSCYHRGRLCTLTSSH